MLGRQNRTLKTDKGQWLARTLFDWVDGDAVDTEVLLAEAAAVAGIVTLRPVRSTNGAVIEAIDGFRWRVYEKPTLGPEPTKPADPRHATIAGRIVARVQDLRLPPPQPVVSWLTYARDETDWWKLHAASAAASAPWAERLAEIIPTLVDVTAVVESVDEACESLLSACHYAPNAFRLAGADDLAVVTWEHAGAMPPRWDLGTALASWSVGAIGEVNLRAAKALLAGYVEHLPLPGRFNLGMFSADVCASLNWLASRITIALDETDDGDEARVAVAARAVPTLLVDPPSRPKLEAILAAVT